jgi:hypothetical protein
MGVDPRHLRPADLARLLNSTGVGTVIAERQLHRHRTRAGFRIGDGKSVDLLTVGAVNTFLTKATDLGCYTQQQYYNFKAIYDLMIELLKKANLDPLRVTVAELKAKAPELLTEHSRNSKATEGTIRTYTARIARLLADFLEHHNGDIAAWKKKIAAIPKRSSKPKPKASAKVVDDDSDDEGVASTMTGSYEIHPITFGSTLVGELRITTGLSADEIAFFWTKLSAIKSTLEVIEALKPEKDK